MTEIQRNEDDPNFAIMAIDIKGAFPHSSRKHIINRIQHTIPELTNIVQFMYLEPNQHQLLTLDGPTEFIQTHGLIQGQELSMLLFSMLNGCILLSTYNFCIASDYHKQYV